MQHNIFAIIIWVISLVCTTSGKIITECCVCDDHSTDPSKRCDVPGICDNSHTYCTEYCLTTRQFIGNTWYTTRQCGLETTCIANWYHTMTELGCIDNTRGEPPNGTTCYQCCKLQDPLQPHFCVDNPDTNFVTFPVTSPATSTTTTTTITTPATMKTTTPIAVTTTTLKATSQLTTTLATVNTTTPRTSGSNGTVCEVGRDGNYTTVTCDATTPQCMNTIIKQTSLTVIKKTCESVILCDQDWWVLTRGRKDCMTSNVTSIPARDEGVVCHYCCKSTIGIPCNNDLIPADVLPIVTIVDGGWSAWGEWQGCNIDCKGARLRVRACNNPTPSPTGAPCPGSSEDAEKCDPFNCHGAGSQVIVG